MAIPPESKNIYKINSLKLKMTYSISYISTQRFLPPLQNPNPAMASGPKDESTAEEKEKKDEKDVRHPGSTGDHFVGRGFVGQCLRQVFTDRRNL
jgi:hypothetical protein